jgi:hypothetical protein
MGEPTARVLVRTAWGLDYPVEADELADDYSHDERPPSWPWCEQCDPLDSAKDRSNVPGSISRELTSAIWAFTSRRGNMG